MEIRKFTTYEFDLKVNNVTHNVVYKKDESGDGESYIETTANGEKQRMDVAFLMSLYEAMKEVDPFGFVFDDLSGGDE